MGTNAEKKIKCVVWDLDGTIWEGTLTEGGAAALRDGVREIVGELDRRGILQSVASKNDHGEAWERLKSFKLDEYFLYPRISWGSKANSIKEIADALNIGTDAFAFVDDSEFERGEVNFCLPEVLAIDAADYKSILAMERMTPRFVTEDASARRKMYMEELGRKGAESGFAGTPEAFLKSLNMKLAISPVTEKDLRRAEELTLRTSQMNATGSAYTYDELRGFANSANHVFLAAELEDAFGSYGKIGLALMESDGGRYVIKLLIVSCRVMTKGIGSTMLIYLIKKAAKDGKKLFAEYIETERNRIMYITYKFMGFSEADAEGAAKGACGGPAADKRGSAAARAITSGASATAVTAESAATPETAESAAAAETDAPDGGTGVTLLAYASDAAREYPAHIEVIEAAANRPCAGE